MRVGHKHGNMRSFPCVSLKCSNYPKSCSWRLSVDYNEMVGYAAEEVAEELVAHYNEGVRNAIASGKR
jgi:hypothetical protein